MVKDRKLLMLIVILVLYLVPTFSGEFEARVFTFTLLFHCTAAGGAARAGVTLQRQACKDTADVENVSTSVQHKPKGTSVNNVSRDWFLFLYRLNIRESTCVTVSSEL